MHASTLISIFNKPWLIEPDAALKLFNYWESARAAGENFDYVKAIGNEQKTTYEIHSKLFSVSGVKVAPHNDYDLSKFEGFQGATVAVIPVSGPLMKNDGFCGELGTKALASLVKMADATESVQAILLIHDSPGGTSDGCESFAAAVKGCRKETISAVEGMMCSADYWVGRAANKIYATSKTDVIGSIGCMCSFYDNTKQLENEGIVLREFYATESKDKNTMFADAKKGNGKKLIAEMLDPMNNVFMQSVKDNRGKKLNLEAENVLTGKTYLSEQAKEFGLIDGIKSIDQIITDLTAKYTPKTFTTSYKINSMTPEQLRAEHPEAVTAIISQAIAAERDRVGVFLAYRQVDLELVNEGIKSGRTMTETEKTELNIKIASSTKLKNLQNANIEPINTDASVLYEQKEKAPKSAQDIQLEEWIKARKG